MFGKTGLAQISESVQYTPAMVTTANRVRRIVAGEEHSLALTENELLCFGSNEFGACAQDVLAMRNISTPMSISLTPFQGDSISKIQAGSHISYALTISGKLYTWGKRYHSVGFTNVPELVSFLLPILDIAAGYYHVIIKANDEEGYAFGDNTYDCAYFCLFKKLDTINTARVVYIRKLPKFLKK